MKNVAYEKSRNGYLRNITFAGKNCLQFYLTMISKNNKSFNVLYVKRH